MREVAALTPHFAGVTYERLGRGGLQWPVAADGTDTPILYEETSSCPRPGAASPRCRTRRRATRPTRTSRSSWSPAGACSTTTPAR